MNNVQIQGTLIISKVVPSYIIWKYNSYEICIYGDYFITYSFKLSINVLTRENLSSKPEDERFLLELNIPFNLNFITKLQKVSVDLINSSKSDSIIKEKNIDVSIEY